MSVHLLIFYNDVLSKNSLDKPWAFGIIANSKYCLNKKKYAGNGIFRHLRIQKCSWEWHSPEPPRRSVNKVER